MQELFLYLEKVHEMTLIPVRCRDSTGEITLFSRGFDSESDPFNYEPLKTKIMNRISQCDEPIVEIEDDMVAYAAMKDIMGYIIVLGPVAFMSLDAKETESYAKQHNINPSGFIFVKQSIAQLYATISLLYAVRYGVSASNTAYTALSSDNKTDNFPPVEAEYMNYVMGNADDDVIRLAYEHERLYVQRIREGIIDEQKPADYRLVDTTHVGKLANKPLKQFEYMICTAITLASRAAIEGGLDTTTSYAMSDVFLQRLEKCTDINSMIALHFEVQSYYAGQVQLARQKRSKSSYVEECKAYIGQNLNRMLSLNDIAGAIGINKSHLSRLFTQETGLSIMQYARKLRVEAAQSMLKYSDESISTIAQYLCFPSQSHFGKVFKEHTGKTPQIYRIHEQVIGPKKANSQIFRQK